MHTDPLHHIKPSGGDKNTADPIGWSTLLADLEALNEPL